MSPLSQISPFGETITTEQELRALLGTPRELVANKTIDHLDRHCRDFIARSPLMLMATANAAGECDVSPRGDAPGAVLVLDERRLVIPDRRGNRRVDSLRNILTNPRVGLLFLIPGLREVLRVNGRACVVKNPELLQRLAAKDIVPQLAIGIEVDECFLHCGKAMIRSQLWNPASWLDEEHLPNPAQILADHAKKTGVTVAEVEESLHEGYKTRLY